VDALPGGCKARVSSPSFNIVNYYPTRPECAHFDLYRLEGFAADESLMEAFEADDLLVIVEWAQYLDPSFMPPDRLDLQWVRSTGEREIILKPTGPGAERYLNEIIAPGARGGPGN
jgi:tRNA threonylcarbamoyladenosine biosynthesis protein TsaE